MMDITFYKASFDKNTPSECAIVELSDDLFEKLAKSEFSQMGISKKRKINLDGELIEVKAVELTPMIRDSILVYLKNLLTNDLQNNLEKLGNSPSTNEFRDYTLDLKPILELIRLIETDTYTHLDRTGS